MRLPSCFIYASCFSSRDKYFIRYRFLLPMLLILESKRPHLAMESFASDI